jgi:hypothetical protein
MIMVIWLQDGQIAMITPWACPGRNKRNAEPLTTGRNHNKIGQQRA